MNDLMQYSLYNKFNNLLITGSIYELTNYIVKNDVRFKKGSLIDTRKIENNLRAATVRKFKPYGYIIKRIWEEKEVKSFSKWFWFIGYDKAIKEM